MIESHLPRDYDRDADKKRPVEIITGYLENNPYSVLIKVGKTKVLCTATGGQRMPPHLRDSESGWITAEYSMLPSASKDRVMRERVRVKGRTREIERLIARSLRSVCELKAMPNQSVIVDCDVIEADGGTRTASITGGFVALYMLVKDLLKQKRIYRLPITDFLAATSVGIVRGAPLLDLNSREDMAAQVDMNLVMTESGRIAEAQATGEEATFTKDQFDEMFLLGKKGIEELVREQKKALGMF